MNPEEFLAKALSVKVDTILSNPNATLTIGEALLIMRDYAESFHEAASRQEEYERVWGGNDENLIDH